MFHVFTPLASRSARLLARALEGRRIQHLHPLPPEDTLINWGGVGQPFDPRYRAYNRIVIGNKYRELELLGAADVPVPPHSLEPREGWLGRSLHHREGTDFIAMPHWPDFWVEPVSTTREFRFHVFKFAPEDIRILRWGEKLPKPNAHPWVRSYRNGWRISYGSTQIPNGLRPIAKAALGAVGYDFGAIDLALKAAGSPIVWEVNGAPGLEGNGQTLLRYAEAFREKELLDILE